MNLSNKNRELSGRLLTATPPLPFNNADYLASMCHKIGTPLTAIIGLSHMLAQSQYSVKQRKKCAEMLNDNATILELLMHNLLDVSKMDTGMMALEQRVFSVQDVMQQAVHSVSIKAARKKLKLHSQVAPGTHSNYWGDPLRVQQILFNLLDNAVKFTEFGYVSIYVDTEMDKEGNEQLSITVADTGCGIGSDVFGTYVQVDASGAGKHGDKGLGLSMSRDLAHMMNGNICVKSWPGFGSHFILTLPLHKA